MRIDVFDSLEPGVTVKKVEDRGANYGLGQDIERIQDVWHKSENAESHDHERKVKLPVAIPAIKAAQPREPRIPSMPTPVYPSGDEGTVRSSQCEIEVLVGQCCSVLAEKIAAEYLIQYVIEFFGNSIGDNDV